MRKITGLSLIAAAPLALATAAPAMAQDLDPVFTGPRVEATLGYDHVGAGSSVANNNGEDDQSIDGLLYGGGIGYDVATSGGLVLGAEGEVTGSTARNSQGQYTNTFGFGRVRQGRDFYVGGRIGVLANPSTLIYAKGGYTNSKLNVLAGSTTQTTDTDFELSGYRVGAGVERALSPTTYGKIEYRYSNYERGRIEYGSGATSNRFDVDTDRHQIVASYGFRF
jgi:outer membrane immunogenic protein